MNDYGGVSRAIREELEKITEAEYYSRIAKNQKDNSFWLKLKITMMLLINKGPK